MALEHPLCDDPMGLVGRGRPRGAETVSDLRIVPAIELLRKEGPGTFVVRDSSSYRGSFGLALKVPEAPAAAQSASGMRLSQGPSEPTAYGGVESQLCRCLQGNPGPGPP